MPQEDEFRVEVDLGDDEHGFTLSERLQALDLDDEARERLGSRVIVTRDGPHIFLYANSDASCREAERSVRDLLAEDELEGTVRSTRWHPVAEEWRPIDDPLPETADEIASEERSRDSHEPDSNLPEAPSFVLLKSYKPRFLRDLGL